MGSIIFMLLFIGVICALFFKAGKISGKYTMRGKATWTMFSIIEPYAGTEYGEFCCELSKRFIDVLNDDIKIK